MNKKKEEQIIQDKRRSGLSYRKLALKYGVSASRVYRMLNPNNKSKSKPKFKAAQEELPDEVAVLKALLRKERLKNELLNNMIDIADKELGTNIRKKPGTRQSE